MEMRKIVKIGTLILIGLLGLMGGVRAQATLSTNTITLGDTTVLTVKAANDQWPTIDGEYIEVLNMEWNEKSGEWNVFLTSYDPGIHYVRWSNDKQDSLQLVVLGVDIDPTNDEIKDIADIEDIVDTKEFENLDDNSKGNNILWLIIIISTAGAAIVGFLLWWRHRKKAKCREQKEDSKDLRSAGERAQEKLEELRKKQLWQSGRVKEYYTELTDTLRVFIEEETGIRATEMTSEDCLNTLMRDCLSADETDTQTIQQSNIQALKSILTTADLVKFAKSEPLAHIHQQMYDNAMTFVRTWCECKEASKSAGENREEVGYE